MMVSECVGIYTIFWDVNENKYYDPCGKLILNIHEYVTPNDIFLFHNHPDIDTFTLIGERNMLCRIIVSEDGWE